MNWMFNEIHDICSYFIREDKEGRVEYTSIRDHSALTVPSYASSFALWRHQQGKPSSAAVVLHTIHWVFKDLGTQ